MEPGTFTVFPGYGLFKVLYNEFSLFADYQLHQGRRKNWYKFRLQSTGKGNLYMLLLRNQKGSNYMCISEFRVLNLKIIV